MVVFRFPVTGWDEVKDKESANNSNTDMEEETPLFVPNYHTNACQFTHCKQVSSSQCFLHYKAFVFQHLYY